MKKRADVFYLFKMPLFPRSGVVHVHIEGAQSTNVADVDVIVFTESKLVSYMQRKEPMIFNVDLLQGGFQCHI